MVPDKVFVRAFRNADCVPGYNASTDVLYNELDTNDSLVLDAGVTVRVHAFATDFVGGTTTVGVSEHVVTNPGFFSLDAVEVFSGGALFAWERTDGDTYFEGTAAESIMQDRWSQLSDLIALDGNSPSQPTTGAFVVKDPEGDEAWLDISITP